MLDSLLRVNTDMSFYDEGIGINAFFRWSEWKCCLFTKFRLLLLLFFNLLVDSKFPLFSNPGSYTHDNDYLVVRRQGY